MPEHPCKCCECKSADLRKKLKISNYETYHDIILIYCTAAVDFAKIAINSILILNGAAGVAVLYNLKSFGENGFELLRSYALGALLAIVCAGMSFVTQIIEATVYMQNPAVLDGHLKNIDFVSRHIFSLRYLKRVMKKKSSKKKRSFKLGIVLMSIVCIIWVWSVVCFYSATYSTFAFLEKQGNGQSMKSQSPTGKPMVCP